MQAMILAAGFGTRLRPYTLRRPKPLFPVLNRPLLPAVAERLRRAGFSRIIVNCHHLREQIVEAVGSISGVVIQEEADILGTGGGLKMALARLADEPLLVTNGDIYHSVDCAAVYRSHVAAGNDATLVLHDLPRFNNVLVTDRSVTAFAAGGGHPGALAFTGVQVVDPALLESIEPGRQVCVIDHYRRLLAARRTISWIPAGDCFWTDIGTPTDYLALHHLLLTGAAPCWPELGIDEPRRILVDPDAECGAGCAFEDWACIGRARIGPGARLRRCVVWDGAVVPGHEILADAIVV